MILLNIPKNLLIIKLIMIKRKRELYLESLLYGPIINKLRKKDGILPLIITNFYILIINQP